MSSIAIITDTDSSLSPQKANELNIIQVPIKIHFEGETYNAVTEIDDARVFERIDHEGKLPTTSAPSPGDFAAAYQTALERGAEGVVCFTVSGAVSATFEAALAGKEMVEDGPIEVVDSRSLSMGQGYMVMKAAELALAGAAKDEIVAAAADIRERSYLFAALSTLKYMAMSGRVGHLTAGMANFFNIKPILTIQDGKLDLLEKVRTKSKSWQRLIELTRGALSGREIEVLSILHVAAPDDAREFEALLREHLECPDHIEYFELTPGLSIHAGAGLVGLTFVTSGN